jgi:uncharacterized protein YegJ (DUF2314 family)
MTLKQRLIDWHSRRFGSWTIDDPRPIAASAPYTFLLPSADLLAAIAAGDLVKAMFRAHPANRKHDAERMWVEVSAAEGDTLIGSLGNEPFDIPQLQAGMTVQLPRTHVMDILWADPDKGPQDPPRRWYWERCMVDDCVAKGRCRVDYLYREEPDMTREHHNYPDSGWRIRGTHEAIADDAASGKSPVYIALGKVLNEDDRWLHLIDEPVGQAFQWCEDEQRFVRLERK